MPNIIFMYRNDDLYFKSFENNPKESKSSYKNVYFLTNQIIFLETILNKPNEKNGKTFE